MVVVLVVLVVVKKLSGSSGRRSFVGSDLLDRTCETKRRRASGAAHLPAVFVAADGTHVYRGTFAPSRTTWNVATMEDGGVLEGYKAPVPTEGHVLISVGPSVF